MNKHYTSTARLIKDGLFQTYAKRASFYVPNMDSTKPLARWFP